jgi:hypothetical protein
MSCTRASLLSPDDIDIPMLVVSLRDFPSNTNTVEDSLLLNLFAISKATDCFVEGSITENSSPP